MPFQSTRQPSSKKRPGPPQSPNKRPPLNFPLARDVPIDAGAGTLLTTHPRVCGTNDPGEHDPLRRPTAVPPTDSGSENLPGGTSSAAPATTPWPTSVRCGLPEPTAAAAADLGGAPRLPLGSAGRHRVPLAPGGPTAGSAGKTGVVLVPVNENAWSRTPELRGNQTGDVLLRWPANDHRRDGGPSPRCRNDRTERPGPPPNHKRRLCAPAATVCAVTVEG